MTHQTSKPKDKAHGQRGRKPAPGPDQKSRDRVRAAFTEAGVTLTGWAKANGFDRQTVADVLLGRRSGHHGEAHRVAVALGLKKGRVVQDPALFNPAAAAGKGA